MEAKFIEFGINLYMREDFYKAMVAYREQAKSNGEWDRLDSEKRRFVDKVIREMERSGLNQPADVRERIIALQNEISNMEREASQNINEDQTKVECEIAKLDGLPEDLIETLESVPEKEATHKYVSMKYPEVFPAMRLVKDEETRKRIVLAKESMC